MTYFLRTFWQDSVSSGNFSKAFRFELLGWEEEKKVMNDDISNIELHFGLLRSGEKLFNADVSISFQLWGTNEKF